MSPRPNFAWLTALCGVCLSIWSFSPCGAADEPLAAAPLGDSGLFIVYGDTRFTDPQETVASNPRARTALVRQVAAEHPGVLILTGDLPWHGGVLDDYQVYGAQTAPWRAQGLRVLPVLGNHEFSGCAQAACLEQWWTAFPELRGRRWYRVDLGPHIRFLALDSNAPLTAGSVQRAWLDQELGRLTSDVRFVLIGLHHPPVADDGWLIVRANERSLRRLLEKQAPRLAARLIVCAGHVHNYERFEHGGVVYLVSGGGGARPLPVRRSAADRYRQRGFPNFHYLRFELQGAVLAVSMIRLEDFDAPNPDRWQIRDRFEISARAATSTAKLRGGRG